MATSGSTKPHSLRVVTFNANGIQNNIDEIREFVKSHDVDILLVQETFLKPSIRNPRVVNYKLVRNDRTRSRLGGTLVYYKKSLHCIPLEPPPLEVLEVSLCKVSMTGHEPIIIASTYQAPSKHLVPSDLKTLFNLGNAVLIAGDLNSHHPLWGNVRSNWNGRHLLQLQEVLEFALHAPDTPTRYDTASRAGGVIYNPTTIDIALAKGISLNVTIETLHELNSDHRPVMITLGDHSRNPPTRKRIIDYKLLAENIQNLQSIHLDKIPDVIDSKEAAIAAASDLTDHLIATIDESSREMQVNHDGHWPLPEDIKESIRLRNNAKRTYDRYPSEEYRRTLRHLEREVKSKIKAHKAERWDRLLSELEPSHVAYWPLAKALKNNTESEMPPLVRPNRPPALENIDKAELLADTFEQQCRPSTLPTDPKHLRAVNEEVTKRLSEPPIEPLRPVAAEEVQDIVKCLNAKKAPGQDGISNKTLKLLPPALIQLLVNIFNALLVGCSFPDIWKTAIVIGIHKPGKPRNDPSSYRPISLLSSLGKIYERILLRRLKDVISDKNLIPDEQFAFREHHSCPAQVHRITEYILESKNDRKNTCAVFFDVAKAFDKIWHQGLIYKLFHLGVPDSLVHVINDYVMNRKFRFRVESALSSMRALEAGVPQGGVLSPSLFNIYTSDSPRHPKVQKALFADDTALFYASRSPRTASSILQRAVTDLGKWFTKWRIEINPEKSKSILFDKRRCSRIANRNFKNSMSPIKLHGKTIPEVNQVKYLGVVLNKSMTFSSHVSNTVRKAKFVLNKLYPLINVRSKMSLRHKLTLYRTCIRPILTYACVSFAHIDDYHMDILQKVQNKFLRMATGAPWYLRNIDLHRDCELITIKAYIKELAESFFEKGKAHPNPLIRRALDYEHDVQTKRYPFKRPKHILGDPIDRITKFVLHYVQARKHKTQAPARLGLHRGKRRRPSRSLTPDTTTSTHRQTDPHTGPNSHPGPSSNPTRVVIQTNSRDRDFAIESSIQTADRIDIRTLARESSRPEGERDCGPLSHSNNSILSSSIVINTPLVFATAREQPHSSEGEGGAGPLGQGGCGLPHRNNSLNVVGPQLNNCTSLDVPLTHQSTS